MMTILSLVGLLVIAPPLGYLLLLAFAAIRPPRPPAAVESPRCRFIVAVAAHDEVAVIRASVEQLLALDYPARLYRVHVVADHCSDDTAEMARRAGAVVHERTDGPRTGKGAALQWLLERVLADEWADAVAVFDADTRVEPRFLRLMDARFQGGELTIQGQHVISNPERGWFPALAWAMFLIDNRFQNLGRVHLGWSAKHMGDSICLRADIVRRIGWGDGLAEDYELRQRLLLSGIRIGYEPAAIGFGEAPPTWNRARPQRARWGRGALDASHRLARRLLIEGLRRRDGAMLDGALQAYLPSFSTLTLGSVLALAVQLLVNAWRGSTFSGVVVGAWAVVVGLLLLYPLFGLALARAPARAYLAILSGPLFVVWRSWLALTARSGQRPVTWIQTAHGDVAGPRDAG
jgi:1,2-diacylglycerol 3-beta-glucosyltransferase